VDFAEPEHISILRQTIQRFVNDTMARDKVAQWDRDNHFPREVFAALADLGVMGLTVPEVYGGPGRDLLAAIVVIEELSKRNLAVAVPYIMSAFYAGMNLLECGSEEQKRRLLPLVAQGKLIFAYGWSEPDVGSDLASVRTTIVRDGNSLVINRREAVLLGK